MKRKQPAATIQKRADAPAGRQIDQAPPLVKKYPIAKTREGKRAATAYLDPEALKALQHIAIDEDRTLQDLLIEGINAVFEKRGMSPIA